MATCQKCWYPISVCKCPPSPAANQVEAAEYTLFLNMVDRSLRQAGYELEQFPEYPFITDFRAEKPPTQSTLDAIGTIKDS